MSDIDIGFGATGLDQIDRALVTLANLEVALDKLKSTSSSSASTITTETASVKELGSALAELRTIANSVQTMNDNLRNSNASVIVGFQNLEHALEKFKVQGRAAATEVNAQMSAMRKAMQEEKWLDAQNDAVKRTQAEISKSQAKSLKEEEAWLDAQNIATRRALAQKEKAYQESLAAVDKAVKQSMKSMTQPGYAAADADWWDKALKKQEAAQNRSLKAEEAWLDAQNIALKRNLTQREQMLEAAKTKEAAILAKNASFNISSPSAQLRTVETVRSRLAVGLDTTSFSQEAVGIAQNQIAYDKLKASVLASKDALAHHNQAMNDAHSFARGLSGALGNLWITYGSTVPIVAGAALAGSLKAVYDVGKEVEYQLKFVQALSDNGEAVNLDRFLKVTDGTVVSVREAANGMRALAQNGLDAQQSLAALPAVLNLATVGELSVADAALSATGVLTAFNLKLSDLERVGDVFAKAAASSNTSVAAMTESMKTASTASSLFGVSLEQTSASIGIMAKLNITGSAAGTAFRNILKDLYEPTNKQASALKAMGVETRTASGQLKDYVLILEDIREKTAKMNEGGRLNFLSQISDERGAKALLATLNNWDEFKKKIQEAEGAAGFMSKTVMQLEDTVEGASKRMSNSFSSTFAKAFAEASPKIQELLLELGDLGKSEELKNFLASTAEGVANVTQFFIEHSGVLKTVIGVYSGFRVIDYLAQSYVAFTRATASATVAQAADAAVAAVRQRSMAALATVTGASAVATEAATVATAANTAAQGANVVAVEAAVVANTALTASGTRAAAAVRLVTASLGPIALALTAAAVAYELFANRSSDADKAMLQSKNTVHAMNEELDRQISKLRERNRLWDEKSGQFKEGGDSKTSNASKEIQSSLLEAEARLSQLQAKQEQLLTSGGSPDRMAAALRTVAKQIAETDSEVKKYRQTLDDLGQVSKKAIRQADESALNSLREDKANLLKDLRAFAAQGNEKTSIVVDGKITGERFIHSDKQRDVYSKANSLIQATLNTPSDDVEAIKKLTHAKEELTKELNKVSDNFEKTDKKATQDIFNSIMAGLQGKIDLIKQQQRFLEDSIKSQVRAGSKGELQGVDEIQQSRLQSLQAEINLTQLQMSIAKDAENKRSLLAKKRAQEEALELARNEQANIAKNASAEIAYKRQHDLAAAEIADLKERGHYVEAAAKEDEELFGARVSALEKDIEYLGKQKETLKDNDEALALNNERLLVTIETLERLRKTRAYATVAAEFKEELHQFDSALRVAQTQIDGLQLKTARDGGLLSALKAGEAAEEIRTKTLVALRAVQEQMRQLKLEGKDVLELEKREASLQAFANKVPDVFRNTLQGVDDLVVSGFKAMANKSSSAFKNSVKSMRDYVQNELINEMYRMFARPFVMQIVANIAGSFGFAGLANAAGNAAGLGGTAGAGNGVGGALSLISSASSLTSLLSKGVSGMAAAGSSMLGNAIGGLGSLTGSSMLQGVGMGLQGTGGVGVVAPELVGGFQAGAGMANLISTAAPYIAAAAAAYYVATKGFGHGDRKTVSEDISAQLGPDGVSGTRNVHHVKEGGWFSSDINGVWNFDLNKGTTMADGVQYTDPTGAAVSAGKAIKASYDSLMAATKAAATMLGKDFDPIKNKSYDLSFDVGKTEQEFKDNMTKAFTTIADSIAKELIPSIESFQKEGEALSQTLARVSESSAGVTEIFKSLGLAVYGTSEAGLKMSSALVEAAGGISNLQSSATTYYNEFYTTQEKTALVTKSLREEFESLSLGALPESRKAYRELVETTRLIGTPEQLAALLKMSSAFAQIVDAANEIPEYVLRSYQDDLTASMKALNDEAGNLRRQEVEARRAVEQAALDAAKAAIDAIKKEVEEKLPTLLASGDWSGWVAENAKLSYPSYGAAIKDGNFNAGAYNKMLSDVRYNSLQSLASYADSNYLSMPNAASAVQAGYSARLERGQMAAEDNLKNSKAWINAGAAAQGQLSYLGSNLGGFLQSLYTRDALGTADDSGTMGNYWGGYGGVLQAEDRLKFMNYNGSGISQDIYEFGTGLGILKAALKSGAITQDTYNTTVRTGLVLLGDSVDSLMDENVMYERIIKTRLQLSAAGVSSIGSVFGQLSNQVLKLNEASQKANDSLALTSNAIGRMSSLSTVLVDSYNATRFDADARTSNLVQSGGVVGLTAGVLSKYLNTAGGSDSIDYLANSASFAGTSSEFRRDQSMIVGGVSANDTTSLENAFVRMSDALGRGIITQGQYFDMVELAATRYNPADAAKGVAAEFANLRSAAKKLRDSLLIDSQLSALSGSAKILDARRQYQETFALAATRDPDAVNRIDSVARAYLSTIQSNSGSVAEYQNAYVDVLAKTAELQQMGIESVDTQQQMLKELRGLQEKFAQMQNNTLSTNAGISKTNSLLTYMRENSINVKVVS